MNLGDNYSIYLRNQSGPFSLDEEMFIFVRNEKYVSFSKEIHNHRVLGGGHKQDSALIVESILASLSISEEGLPDTDQDIIDGLFISIAIKTKHFSIDANITSNHPPEMQPIIDLLYLFKNWEEDYINAHN